MKLKCLFEQKLEQHSLTFKVGKFGFWKFQFSYWIFPKEGKTLRILLRFCSVCMISSTNTRRRQKSTFYCLPIPRILFVTISKVRAPMQPLFRIKEASQTTRQILGPTGTAKPLVLLNEKVHFFVSEFDYLRHSEILNVVEYCSFGFSKALELGSDSPFVSDSIKVSLLDSSFKKLCWFFQNITWGHLYFQLLTLTFIKSFHSPNQFVAWTTRNQHFLLFSVFHKSTCSEEVIFSLSNAEMTWFSENGPELDLLEVCNNSSKKEKKNSIKLFLSVLNFLHNQRLQFIKEALTVASPTQRQQNEPYEVHENLGKPATRELILGWEGQETVIHNVSSLWLTLAWQRCLQQVLVELTEPFLIKRLRFSCYLLRL